MAGSSGNAEKNMNLTSPAVVSRLPTFKGPRDLTLSSVVRARRQYAPNIPPKRDRAESAAAPQSPKSSPKFVQPSLPGPSELKHKRPRPAVAPGLGIHGRRGGGRGREKPALVQSVSIFSEGVGAKSLTSRRTPSTFSSSGRGRGRRGRGGGGRPSISTTELENVLNKESRKSAAQDRQDDKDFIDDDDDDEEPIGGLGTFMEGLSQGPLPHHLKPVSLPLDHYFTRLTTKTDELKTKPKKARPGDSFSQFLSSAPKGTLACLQMPYLLPFRRKKKDPEPTADSNKPYVKNLSDVKGGCIGKLQVRKSGKCYLLLGKSKKSEKVTFEVEPSKVVGFRQELVAINTEKKSFTMLGKVQHKFVCTPDPDPLFHNRLQFRH